MAVHPEHHAFSLPTVSTRRYSSRSLGSNVALPVSSFSFSSGFSICAGLRRVFPCNFFLVFFQKKD